MDNERREGGWRRTEGTRTFTYGQSFHIISRRKRLIRVRRGRLMAKYSKEEREREREEEGDIKMWN
jgi:hypothetical protein